MSTQQSPFSPFNSPPSTPHETLSKEKVLVEMADGLSISYRQNQYCLQLERGGFVRWFPHSRAHGTRGAWKITSAGRKEAKRIKKEE